MDKTLKAEGCKPLLLSSNSLGHWGFLAYLASISSKCPAGVKLVILTLGEERYA